LPSKIELESIVDETKANPAIDGRAFPSTPAEEFLSTSPIAAAPVPGWWWFDFSEGGESLLSTGMDGPYRVRCVRGPDGQASPGNPAKRYAVSNGGVTDTRSGLVWQSTVSASTYTWEAAKTHCSGIGGGWRLPSLKELLTLVDPTRTGPCIDPVFSGTATSSFWTASPYVVDPPGYAWVVSFGGGEAGGLATTVTNYVRCVR
jgi:hypothetical protein